MNKLILKRENFHPILIGSLLSTISRILFIILFCKTIKNVLCLIQLNNQVGIRHPKLILKFDSSSEMRENYLDVDLTVFPELRIVMLITF